MLAGIHWDCKISFYLEICFNLRQSHNQIKMYSLHFSSRSIKYRLKQSNTSLRKLSLLLNTSSAIWFIDKFLGSSIDPSQAQSKSCFGVCPHAAARIETHLDNALCLSFLQSALRTRSDLELVTAEAPSGLKSVMTVDLVINILRVWL